MLKCWSGIRAGVTEWVSLCWCWHPRYQHRTSVSLMSNDALPGNREKPKHLRPWALPNAFLCLLCPFFIHMKQCEKKLKLSAQFVSNFMPVTKEILPNFYGAQNNMSGRHKQMWFVLLESLIFERNSKNYNNIVF